VATPPSALHIFVRERCPHRAQAELFLIGLARERPAVPIVDRPVGRSAGRRGSEAPGAGADRARGQHLATRRAQVRVRWPDAGRPPRRRRECLPAVRALMVAPAVVALESREQADQVGRWLKLLSCVVTIALAGALPLRPPGLG
jgi:hypothetical protein